MGSRETRWSRGRRQWEYDVSFSSLQFPKKDFPRFGPSKVRGEGQEDRTTTTEILDLDVSPESPVWFMLFPPGHRPSVLTRRVGLVGSRPEEVEPRRP